MTLVKIYLYENEITGNDHMLKPKDSNAPATVKIK